MTADSNSFRQITRGRAALIVACLIAVFAGLAWTASAKKSATFDEPYHSTSAWLSLWRNDLRVDQENGPLWHAWAALPNGPNGLRHVYDAQPGQKTRTIRNYVDVLYHTPANQPDRFMRRQRMMMLLLGAALASSVAWWAFRLAGALAAVVSAFAFCFDPNFLAHAPLIKDDVAFSMLLLWFAALMWRTGQRLTWLRLAAVGLLIGAAFTVKFSALLLWPMLALLLVLRVLLPLPWPTPWGEAGTYWRRGVVAAVVGVVAIGLCFGWIWAAYQFRFAPTRDPNTIQDLAGLQWLAQWDEAVLRTGNPNPTPEQFNAPLSLPIRAVNWANAHRVLPQPFLCGFLFTYATTLVRPTFLMGRLSRVGVWYYFPLAILFKTPLSTLASWALTLVAAVLLVAKRRVVLRGATLWTALCLAVPPAIYLASTMRSHLNLGLRHVLPVVPFAFVIAGVVASLLWKHWPAQHRRIRAVLLLLACGLAVETLNAFPDYVPFFNLAFGGARGGVRLLGDSNLDWGQDLPALARWQRQHPKLRLYVSYFGQADPAYYGIRFENLPGSFVSVPAVAWPTVPCILAISATNLQGIWLDHDLFVKYYQPLQKQRPFAVLGGSIYLYELKVH